MRGDSFAATLELYMHGDVILRKIGKTPSLGESQPGSADSSAFDQAGKQE
jgi:hypothetical protein